MQRRVEEHAKRAPEPWIRIGKRLSPVRARQRLRRPYRAGFMHVLFPGLAPWAVLRRAFSAKTGCCVHPPLPVYICKFTRIAIVSSVSYSERKAGGIRKSPGCGAMRPVRDAVKIARHKVPGKLAMPWSESR